MKDFLCILVLSYISDMYSKFCTDDIRGEFINSYAVLLMRKYFLQMKTINCNIVKKYTVEPVLFFKNKKNRNKKMCMIASGTKSSRHQWTRMNMMKATISYRTVSKTHTGLKDIQNCETVQMRKSSS